MAAKIRWQILVAMVIMALALPCFDHSAMAQDKKPVKLGLTTWKEGPALEAGRSHVRALEDGIKYMNEKGGILGGRKAVGVVAPQGDTGETAKASALKLAMKDNVDALIGPMWTMAAPAGLSVAKPNNLPFLAYQGGTWLYQQNYLGTAIFAANAYGRTNAQMKWAEKHGFKKVAFLFSDIPYNHDVEGVIKEKWGKPDSSVKMLDFIYYTWGQAELKKELTKAIALGADLIWTENWSASADVATMTTIRELAYKGAVILTPSVTWNSIQKTPRTVTEGFYVASEWIHDPKIPENEAFYQRFRKAYGYPPQSDEQVIWMETVFILMAMDKAGTTGERTPEGLKKIHDAYRNLDWITPFGSKVTLTKEGLATWQQLAFSRITNGEFVLDTWIPVSGKEWWPF